MKKVICVVEDEKAINDLVNQYLKKEAMKYVLIIHMKKQVTHVMDDDVHLWILDIMLDDKSGFDLIEEIRLQGRGYPVISCLPEIRNLTVSSVWKKEAMTISRSPFPQRSWCCA